MYIQDSSVRNFIDLNNLAAAKRILWGAAFSLAILKTIKVRVKTNYVITFTKWIIL